MKYIVELKKDGQLRSRKVLDNQATAMDMAAEWSGRCVGNTAAWHKEDKVWFAIYESGLLTGIVDDERLDRMKAGGMFRYDEIEYMMVRGNKFYDTLREAMTVELNEFFGKGEQK